MSAVYGTKFKIDKKYAPIKALGKGEPPHDLSTSCDRLRSEVRQRARLHAWDAVAMVLAPQGRQAWARMRPAVGG